MGNMGKAFRLQSAMEYLMTYGWAILIIAVVLGALFSLGIFNPAFLAPKVQPGSCQVERPDGPGTTSYISLQGNCRNELPEYTATFPGANFNPSNTFTSWCSNGNPGIYCINIDLNTVNLNSCNMTLTAWAYDSGIGPGGYFPYPLNQWVIGNILAIPANAFMGGVAGVIAGTPTGAAVDFEYNDTLIRYESFSSSSSETLRYEYFEPGNFKDRWIQLAEVVNSGYAYGYLDGRQVTTPSPLQVCYQINNTYTFKIGSWDFPFHGYISNIQIYDKPLSGNAIKALYDYGIGSSPIDISSIAGWWPLNGNAKDYSGNENDGQNANIIYSSGWTSGYTAP